MNAATHGAYSMAKARNESACAGVNREDSPAGGAVFRAMANALSTFSLANSPAKRKFLNGWLNRLGDLESTIALA